MLLPDELVERTRPHPGGKWSVASSACARSFCEEAQRIAPAGGLGLSGHGGTIIAPHALCLWR